MQAEIKEIFFIFWLNLSLNSNLLTTSLKERQRQNTFYISLCLLLVLNHFYPNSHLFVLQTLVIRDSSTSLQTHHVDSMLKRRGKHRFHVVSTWNLRNLFRRVFSQRWYKSQPPHTKNESILPSTGNQNTALNMTKYEFSLTLFCPYKGKSRSVKTCILIYFMQ